jgi:U4/U6 small nuclear ribonucleoprotein PRP31
VTGEAGNAQGTHAPTGPVFSRKHARPSTRTDAQLVKGAVEDHAEYNTILEANSLILTLYSELLKVHKFVKQLYKPRFPELESLVLNPLEFIRAVERIGNRDDIGNVDMTDILPAAQVMVVSVTATTTSGQALPDDVFKKLMIGVDLGLEIDRARSDTLSYVESRMEFIAPNLSEIVGSNVAAKLMGLAGGITALSKMPSNNLQILGAKRTFLAGMSTKAISAHVGVIGECPIMQSAPPTLRKRVLRLLAGKCGLAARVDSFHDAETHNANVGRQFKAFIEKRIKGMQELPPARRPKPLAIPDERPKTKRGGRRHRKMKERYAMTELRKQKNRLGFGPEAQDSTFIGDTVKDFGMIGKSTGTVRVAAVDKGLLKKYKQNFGGSSLGSSGLSSSLAFTPIQGLELQNPEANKQKQEDAEKYFGTASTFANVGGGKLSVSKPISKYF